MFENLASSFRQEYPCFEIIFSVAQINDPAIAVVKDLMNQFPKVDARLVIGEKNVGINPKINNMIQSYETAKYDIVWVLDSNVYVDPGCMGRSVDKMMQPGVGLVHHLPIGVRPQTLGSELELMFLDTVHAKMYLFINWTGLASCVVGKSSLYRRSDLDKVGGLAKFGQYMAEDNLVATEIFNMGYKHEMTSDLAYQSLGSMTTSDYFLRRARWARIRKYAEPGATVVEPFIEMIGCGLVASYGFNLLWQTHFLNFMAFHIVIWFLIDLSMYQALSGQKVDNLRGFLMAWCLREIAALPLYVYAVSGSTVDWRDQTFLLRRGGTVQPLEVSTLSAGMKDIKSGTRAISSGSGTGSASPPPTASLSTVPLPPTSSSTAFANLANTVVPESAQNSVRNFFQRPAVISIVRNTFAVIHFVVDILIKSQRNGNEDDNEDRESEDELVETLFEVENGGSRDRDGHLKNSMLKHRKRATMKRSSHLLQALPSSGGSMEDPVYDGDESSAAENGVIFHPRRSARLKLMRSSSPQGSSSLSGGNKAMLFKHGSDSKAEIETRHNSQLTEEDALSKAVEPYLSDSLSRRRRVRRELSATSSQFMSL
ncbi:hypothetical protein BGZ98_006896 [Dissophora globulifera]|nr:hypothetical protein BGZ98_006896 [Dissophora globulifera]